MNIQISLILCLLLTMLTGTIAYLFFLLIKFLTAKLLIIKTYYILLRIVILCSLIPFCFGYEVIRHRDIGWWTGYFSFSTEVLVVIANAILAVWGVGMVINVIRIVKDYRNVRMYLSVYTRYSGNDELILKEVKKTLNISAKVRLYKGIFYDSPMISGVFVSGIYIPERIYSDEQLKYVFLHELIHHKHRDMLMMLLTNILYIVYWFHPLFGSKFIQNQYRELMEDTCDIEVCRISGDRDSYIKVLVRLVIDAYESYNDETVFLTEHKSDVIRRIENMRKYKAQKSLKKVFVVILSATLFLGSTLAVYAAESGVTEGYDKVYEASWDGTSEIVDDFEENTLTEYYEESPVYDNIEIEYFDTSLLRSTTVNINLTVSADSEKRGSLHKLSAGDSVRAAVSIEPGNKNVRIGLVKSDGSIRYVSGSGDIYHTFTIYESGYYRFFVQNSNSTSVYVAGYYKIL